MQAAVIRFVDGQNEGRLTQAFGIHSPVSALQRKFELLGTNCEKRLSDSVLSVRPSEWQNSCPTVQNL